MAEASPICRGKNLTLETVLSFVNAMPLVPMKKTDFHSATESKLKGWAQTHSQIARQLALYYEKDGMCLPIFTRKVSCSEILRYVANWQSYISFQTFILQVSEEANIEQQIFMLF